MKIKRKLTASIIAVLVTMSLAGCGGKSGETSAEGKNQFTPGTDRNTESEIGGDINKPHIDIGNEIQLPDPTGINTEVELPSETETETETETEPEEIITSEAEVTTEKPVDNGNYHYTIYNGIDITLPVDIEDYANVDESGSVGYKISRLAFDYGWERIYDSDQDKNMLWYDLDADYRICLQYWGDNDMMYDYDAIIGDLKYTSLKALSRTVIAKDYGNTIDYTKANPGDGNRGTLIHFPNEPLQCEHYILSSNPRMGCTRDTIILIAYIVTSVKSVGGGDPLYYGNFGHYLKTDSGNDANNIYQLPQ